MAPDMNPAVIKERMSNYLRSPDFDEYFENLHLWPTGAWAIALIAPFTIIGLPLALTAWRRIFAGDLATKRLRNRYRQLAATGEVILTYVVVANSALMRSKGTKAPALVVGNFSNDRDHSKIIEKLEVFADAALGGSDDEELTRLLGDLDYSFGRRRHIPPKFTDGVELMAFDLQIIGDHLPTRTLDLGMIPCFAEPGEKGLICMIPFKLFEDLIPGATEEVEEEE